DFPLSEDLVERARITIVHSEHARTLVQRFVPEAPVAIVPMGIPLPWLTDQSEARRLLGLPQSAFIVASITHVNPNKRLSVVFRALRAAAYRVPELLFVVAGSVSPSVNLPQLAVVSGMN